MSLCFFSYLESVLTLYMIDKTVPLNQRSAKNGTTERGTACSCVSQSCFADSWFKKVIISDLQKLLFSHSFLIFEEILTSKFHQSVVFSPCTDPSRHLYIKDIQRRRISCLWRFVGNEPTDTTHVSYFKRIYMFIFWRIKVNLV